jgi:phosphoglycolate phosphatase-like HAD superfamily hydrolase
MAVPSSVTSGPDIPGLLKDSRFNALDVSKQKDVLGRIDPRFAKLSDTDYQTFRTRMGGSGGGGGDNKGKPKEPGWWQGFGQMGVGIAKSVGRTVVNVDEILETVGTFGLNKAREALESKGEKEDRRQARELLEPKSEKEEWGGNIGEGFQYLVQIGTGTILEELGLTAVENAPLILKLLSGASKAAIDVGIKTFAMTKDTNKALEAAGIAAPFGGAYALKGTAAAKALGSLPGFVVRRIPVIGKPIGTMIDVAKALKGIAMPGAKQAELEAGLYEETYGKLPEAASEKANAKALWQETIRKERLNLRNAKPPAKPVPPRETPREQPGWVKAGVKPETAKAPAAVEPVETELPSGRKPGPAGPRPKPPERKPLWAGIKPAVTEEEEAAQTKPSLQKRIEQAREETKANAAARKKPLVKPESSRLEPASGEPPKPAMREGTYGNPYKESGNLGTASRDMDPGKIENMQAHEKNVKMAARFKSLGMTPEQVSKMTESEYEQHRIAENLVRKQKGLSQFQKPRPGPHRRSFAELKTDIVREMKKGIERPD